MAATPDKAIQSANQLMGRKLLETIKCPEDLRSLSYRQLDSLALEIRRTIVQTTSTNGGHPGSSLGAVEIILALHRKLDCPKDRLVFDIGHQSYAHKIVTGRFDLFDTLRSFGGISGFTRPEESPFDVHASGHASDSLPTAVGLAHARDLQGGDEKVVALIGDAALGGGVASEALNQIGQRQTKMVILLNDNEMSISRNAGARSIVLSRVRSSKEYRTLRDNVENSMNKAGKVGRALMDVGDRAKESVKKFVLPKNLFEEMGIFYIGPIDGHDIPALEMALDSAFALDGPVIVHAVTKKGKGYLPAEQEPERFHGIGSFDLVTGASIAKSGGAPSYTKVFSQALLNEAAADEKIIAITAAMEDGTGLAAFHEKYPDRFFDVGIAEEYAVNMATGAAIGGLKPVVAIYSTFLQRGFDQLIINAGLQNLPVVFCVDRAGLVGEDGATHHGAFDIAYLSMIPTMRVLAPSNEAELVNALHTALALNDGPVAIRYPRGSGEGVSLPEKPEVLPYGKGVQLQQGKDVALLALGRMVSYATKAAELLKEQGIEAAVYDMRWAKPIDEEILRQAAVCPLAVTIEDGSVVGGFGSAVLEHVAALELEEGLKAPEVLTLGLPDEFIAGGPLRDLFEYAGLNPQQLAARITEAYRRVKDR